MAGRLVYWRFISLAAVVLAGCSVIPKEASDAIVSATPEGMRGNVAAGMNVVRTVPVEEEVAIGKEEAGRLLGAAPLVKDQKAQRYVNEVGNWVAAQAGRPELTWRFGIIDSPDINSFALPGGYIFITKGLYSNLSSEAQLAGVLGHEIAHVVKQHHVSNWKKSQAIAMGEKAGSAQLQKQTGGNALGQEAVNNVLGNGAEMLARGLDRSAEEEADRLGVMYATKAGYSPWGLVDVLQTLSQINPSASGVALLFKTHPQPQVRLDALSVFMGDQFDTYAGYEGAGMLPTLAQAHKVVHHRARRKA